MMSLMGDGRVVGQDAGAWMGGLYRDGSGFEQ